MKSEEEILEQMTELLRKEGPCASIICEDCKRVEGAYLALAWVIDGATAPAKNYTHVKKASK